MAKIIDEAIAYWRLNDSANVTSLVDSSGNGAVATTNGTTIVTGFDGKGIARTLPNGTYIVRDNILPADSDFTMSAWLKLGSIAGAAIGSTYTYYLLGMTNKAAYGVAVGVVGAGKLSISYYSPTEGHNAFVTNVTLNTTDWIHVALVRSGTTYKIYFNGALVGTKVLTHTVGVTFATCYVNGGYNTYARSNGTAYDEIAIWNKPLTDTQVMQVYTGVKALALFSSTDKKIRKLAYSGFVNHVPTMTTNTSPSGIASASSFYHVMYSPWVAFNKTSVENGTSIGDCWATVNGTPTGWLAYEFDYSRVINKYVVQARTRTAAEQMAGPSAPRDWTLEASNNGVNYVTLHTVTNSVGWVANERREFAFRNNTSYKHYRLNVTANNGNSSFLAIGELELHEEASATVTELSGDLEQLFLTYGLQTGDLSRLDVNAPYSRKNYINHKSTPITKGKVFTQTLDVTKPINSISVK